MIPQDTEAADMAFVGYLTTNSASFADDEIITARSTGAGGGNLSLTAKRVIKSNEPDAAMIAGEGGTIAIWLETSNTALSEDARVYLEVWGRFVDFTTAA